MRLKILLIASVVLLLVSGLSGYFYWFQWRPSEIRKQCSGERDNYLTSELSKIKDGTSEFITTYGIFEYVENESKIKAEARKSVQEEGQRIYERCLNSKGVK